MAGWAGVSEDSTTDDRPSSQVLDIIRQISAWMGELPLAAFMDPSETSQASADLRVVTDDPVRTTRLKYGLGLTGYRLHSGRSCLDALVASAAIPDPTTPVHVLARTIIETSAWVKWLCDMSLTVDERISRIAADELHGNTEARRLLAELGMAPSGRDELVAELEAAAIIPASRPGSTAVVGLALRPITTPALRTYYRLLSARPHSSSHMLSAAPALAATGRPTRLCASIFMWSVFEFTQYIGWNRLPEWTAWANNVNPLLSEPGLRAPSVTRP